ncbi:hypothetical protein Q3G72_010562 [Acer saccharum]|nr:hypothetical protein Q3G72_011134 [Acer saccharum]KAK1587200.1 hypothetical protein Q3G72_010562 [Acer saccharum]
MEKNELSRIPDPDPDEVVSPDNPDDPNDPVVTTDDPNDPATDAVRRRNIEVEKIGPSRSLPDPDIAVSPDGPNDPVVTTDDPDIRAFLTNTLMEIRSTCAFVIDTLKEIRAEQEKAPVPYPYPPSPPAPDAPPPVVKASYYGSCEEREYPTVRSYNLVLLRC